MLEKIYIEKNIYYVENFLSDEEIENILKDDLKWNKRDEDGSNSIYLSELNKSKKFFKEIIEKKIKNLVNTEQEKYKNRYLLAKYLPTKNIDQSLGWHYENHPECDYESRWINLGIVIYFNDNYGGGELVFKYKDVGDIKLKKGSIIVFPSTEEYTHMVKKTTSGERIAFSAFIYDKQYWDILDRSGWVDPENE